MLVEDYVYQRADLFILIFKNIMLLEIAKEPQVKVTVFADDCKIIRSHLSLASTFQLEFMGPLSQLETTRRWLSCYAEKKESLDTLLYDLQLSNFFQKILEAIKKIPPGKTISYKDLATICGNEKASRAVGKALNKNPFPLFIPCHRVISKTGALGGFAYGLELKKALLFFEKNT